MFASFGHDVVIVIIMVFVVVVVVVVIVVVVVVCFCCCCVACSCLFVCSVLFVCSLLCDGLDCFYVLVVFVFVDITITEIAGHDHMLDTAAVVIVPLLLLWLSRH